MDAITTSGSTEVAHANTLRGEWARFGSFLKRPVLPERAPLPNLTSLAAVWRLLVLDLLIMSMLLAAGALASAAGVELPETALAGMELSPGLILAAVVFAPLGEELLFRSWLSGRPGHMLAFLALLGGGTATALAVAGRDQAYYLTAATITLLLTALALYLLRRRNALRWFARIFPIAFWLSALLFASAHLFNFSEENLLALAPLVLPQFAIGLVLGYARVNYGLWSSMLLHLLHNGAFISLVLLASSAA
ncbi:CPBP family intramembrane glutamic endopeptidase [Erythrobacter mangrovi]|uniref:CPBP family intramembrane metalloprotease n=1 Tax=Erythrobacter mangrovi TaxID=2739433 RepID=A0A7D3Y149_9SPHN|nr:CPBP family intramembrane glutamic endopeptidase [Erythrobacter mangrovi]QKG72252.1 CPBP family intramembrane metalloprotease [Erythrobacter mangrovi]